MTPCKLKEKMNEAYFVLQKYVVILREHNHHDLAIKLDKLVIEIGDHANKVRVRGRRRRSAVSANAEQQ